MAIWTTPGGFGLDRQTLPPPVAEVATAVPAFVGYTETATRLTPGDLRGQPTRINSLAAFEALFGTSPCHIHAVVVDDSGHFVSARLATRYVLHDSLALFFANGGQTCVVVSVGSAGESAPERQQLLAGLASLATLDEPTLLLCPDAARLASRDLAVVQHAMLYQCSRLQNRFAVLDTRLDDPLARAFRANIGQAALCEGAAYTPWLLLRHDRYPDYAALRGKLRRRGRPINWRDLTHDAAVLAHLQALDHAIDMAAPTEVAPLQAWLETHCEAYQSVVSGVLATPVACPPGGAVAGVYAAMDAQHGVWRAPANVVIAGVTAPAVALDAGQASALMGVGIAGKPVNAIRTVAGRGVMIWGARTLAGQANAWRYVAVRRFAIQLQASLQKAIAWVRCEPNHGPIWDLVRCQIGDYLLQKWQDGALMGASPDQAYVVRCGPDLTMTARDVREGRLIIDVGVAVLRPGEFTLLRLVQQTRRADQPLPSST